MENVKENHLLNHLENNDNSLKKSPSFIKITNLNETPNENLNKNNTKSPIKSLNNHNKIIPKR